MLESRDAICVWALLLMEKNALQGRAPQNDAWAPPLTRLLLLVDAHGTVRQLHFWRAYRQQGWVMVNQTSLGLFGSM